MSLTKNHHEEQIIAFANLRLFTIEALEKAAVNRLPGYMDAVVAVGKPYVDHEDGNKLKGYRLSTEQMLDLKTRFNPADVAGQKRLAAAVVYNERKTRERKILEPALQQITDDDTPCEFPGCEELKSSYQRDVLLLGEECTECERTELRKKYREILRTTFAPLLQ